MSELEQMREMLSRAEVVFEELEGVPRPKHDEALRLAISEGDGPNNLGYREFVTEMGFNDEGRLLWVGAWE